MDIQLISGILSLIAFGIYIYSIVFGSTRPSKSSWWILTVVWVVVLFSSLEISPGVNFSEKWNALASNWISLAYIGGSLCIAMLSVWKGSRDPWGKFDWFCALFAGISLVIFVFFKQPFVSLIAAILADVFGIIPTIRNAWRHPYAEDFPAWFLESVASLLAVVSVTRWTFDLVGASDWITPLYLFSFNTIITLLIVYGRNFRKKTH